MSKNILFIGGAGFIGSNLVKKFVKEKTYRIFILEPKDAHIDRLKPYTENIYIERGDLQDINLVRQILKNNRIDVIVHLVSRLLPGSTFEDYQSEMNDIILPSMNLMQICSEMKIKFVYFSSGGTIYGNTQTGFYTEEDKLEPISYYGLSKAMMEKAIEFEHRRANLDYLILRPSNPYGNGQNLYGDQGLIAIILGRIIQKKSLTIWGDGNIVRDYIYIDDLSDNVYKLISGHIRNQVINIGSGIGYSVNNIIQIIQEIIGFQINITYVDKRSVDVSTLVLSIDKLKSLVEFQAVDIKEGIKLFFKQNLNG